MVQRDDGALAIRERLDGHPDPFGFAPFDHDARRVCGAAAEQVPRRQSHGRAPALLAAACGPHEAEEPGRKGADVVELSLLTDRDLRTQSRPEIVTSRAIPDVRSCGMSAIDDRYNALGGPAGFLGEPISDEQQISPPGASPIHVRIYQYGAIYWITTGPSTWRGLPRPQTSQTFEVHGAIWEHYQRLGREGVYGLPTSDETGTPDGIGRFNTFANGGAIYWTGPTGAHEVHGAIHERWIALGTERSPLGYPTTDETGTPDGVGRFNQFQGGSIYWTPTTGAHETHGAIGMLWSSMNWERSALGYPTSDENPCPDGVGRFNHFQGGGIYWTPDTGAHETHGAIWTHWAASGWERGKFGYPRTSEYRTLDEVDGDKHLRISSFQRGFIAFDERDGSVAESTQDPFDGLLAIAVPIYWGTQWDPAHPTLAGQSWQDIDSALGRMLGAGICDGLRGYGIVGVAKANPTWLNEQVPPRFFDALPFGANPQTDPSKGFTDKDLTDRITRAVTAGQAPWPQHEKIEPQHLPPLTSRLSCYLVFLPQGCHFTSDPWLESGHHSAFTFQAPNWDDKPDVRFAWIGQDATIDKTMETAVHELVEAFNDAAGLEIGDRCQANNKSANPNNDGFFATVDGVSYRSYWSNFHKRCIAPPAADPATHQVAVE